MRFPACALAIGGLDPGGGAGIVADLRAFAAAGVYGCAAVAVWTVQSTAGLVRARALPSHDVAAQIAEVMAHQRVRSLKVGALGSAANVIAVAGILAQHPTLPVVVDTPMRPTREADEPRGGARQSRGVQSRVARSRASGGGGALLAPSAIRVLRESLLPLATLTTVNAPEAAALLGAPVRSLPDARAAAAELARVAGRAVLVKGGHLAGRESVDVLAVDGDLVELRAPRLPIGAVHGTGCTFASLIAGCLAAVPGASARRVPSARRAVSVRVASAREVSAREMSAREMSAREMSAREMSAREMSAREMSAREMSAREVDRATLEAAVRWAKRVHHRALARAANVGDGACVLVF